jgi:manganese/zinc/iron transport system permease protein
VNAIAAFLTQHQLALWTIVAGAVSNSACAILGCFLVLRRMSLLGDAISHSVLPGIVVAFLLTGSLGGWPIFLAAVVLGLLTALLVQTLSGWGSVPEDVSMGIVFTSLFALGVFLLTNFARHVDLDPGCVLYGLIEFLPLDTVSLLGYEVPRAMGPLGIALLATVLFVTVFWKELKIASFDPDLASAMGIPALAVHYLLMAMVAVVTVAAFEVVGSVIVVAMLIVPPATAHLLTDRLDRMLAWSVLVAVVSAVLGYLAAAQLNTTVAGMMAVAAGCQFALAVVFAPHYGLLSKVAHNFAISLRIVGEDVVAMLYRAEEAASGSGGRRTTWGECARAAGSSVAAWLACPWLWRHRQIRFDRRFSPVLTERGREAARSLVRAHRLWESFLDENFQLPLDHLHEPAQRIEHYLGPQLQERVAAELRKPNLDPHGRKIPPLPSPLAPGDSPGANT